jgi:hypothetical protein
MGWFIVWGLIIAIKGKVNYGVWGDIVDKLSVRIKCFKDCT